MGVACSVPGFVRAGGHRNLHPAPAPGDADLPGDQGQGADDQVSMVDPLTSAYIVGAALLIATPSLIFFGWLSDQIGRKPVILGGMLLAAITYYPLYLWLGTVTQPGNIDYPIAIFIIFILVCYVGMVYG